MPSSTVHTNIDDYPSLLWVALPPVFLISAYYIRKWYLARRLKLYGIGKGAPGFQTNVSRIRVTPEIAARIRRGENVSPAEIEAASRALDEKEARERVSNSSKPPSSTLLSRGVIEERDDRHLINNNDNDTNAINGNENESNSNEWLPDSITKPATKRRKGRK